MGNTYFLSAYLCYRTNHTVLKAIAISESTELVNVLDKSKTHVVPLFSFRETLNWPPAED